MSQLVSMFLILILVKEYGFIVTTSHSYSCNVCNYLYFQILILIILYVFIVTTNAGHMLYVCNQLYINLFCIKAVLKVLCKYGIQ